MLNGVIITPLKIINTPGGNVMHAMKNSSLGFSSFGEAYFSKIDGGAIKGWKRHKEMTLNLIVPIGEVRFILCDDQNTVNNFQEVILSDVSNYFRLTVPPMMWFAFQGLDQKGSVVLNIANIEHSPYEVERKELNEIEFNWK